MIDLLWEAVWHAAQAPTWLGWSLLTAGFTAAGWLLGQRDRQ